MSKNVDQLKRDARECRRKNSPSAGIISLTSTARRFAERECVPASNYARSTSSFSDTLISADTAAEEFQSGVLGRASE